jgi:hypothetical protein
VVAILSLACDLLPLRRAQVHRHLAAVAVLLPFFRRLTPRSARLRARSAWRRCRGVCTTGPSAVTRTICSPTSLPVALPVRGRGGVGTAAQEQPTYQPPPHARSSPSWARRGGDGSSARPRARSWRARGRRRRAARRCRTPCR